MPSLPRFENPREARHLKAVERVLGIQRRLRGVDGFEAVRLWNRFERFGDHDALEILLEYNREDVLDLRMLRRSLRTG